MLSVIGISLQFFTPTFLPTKSRRNFLRKIFHIAIFLIALPAVFIDLEFLRTVLGIVFILFLLSELVRSSRFFPTLSDFVDNFFKNFIDSRDDIYFVSSYIYLLLGISLPLWLQQGESSTEATGNDQELIYSLTGILALGIQDSTVRQF